MRGLSRRAVLERAVEMLALVHIPNPKRRVNDYPHQFSGGMRQRVMIAMALSCNPKLLIADEPTTALDVTIQAQILELLQDMKARFGMAIMLITHDMGVVAEIAQRVVVMYAGKVVEEAPVEQLFANPRHPYTQGLIRSIPRIDTAAAARPGCETIAGTVPKPDRAAARLPLRAALPLRDRRVPRARSRRCASSKPGHKVACIHAEATVVAMSEPLLSVREPDQALPGQGRPARPRGRQRARGRRRRASTSAAARRSGWSANPAAASRRPGAASCA